MRHHMYHPEFSFVEQPAEFSKYTERELLQYCLGATLYMPASKDIAGKIFNGALPGLTSMVMCFEDAINETEVPAAEANVINLLDSLSKALASGALTFGDIPLISLRVRNIEHFKSFTAKLTDGQLEIITAFIFPKFSTGNGYLYLNHLESLNEKRNSVIYGMPILESREIAYKETRTYELTGIKGLLKPYRELILNVRVGATDFSSKFGVRRGVEYSIYDILPVRDCLSDILNFLGREDDHYVISAPVWEYFLADRSMKFDKTLEGDISSSLLKRNVIINEATDGLLREVILDKANGFIGKTTIHPTHIKYVNAMQSVTKEEYQDATQILKSSGAVVKSESANKMNEINPHKNWAEKTVSRAKAYGVIEDEASYVRLFSVEAPKSRDLLSGPFPAGMQDRPLHTKT